jgi:soluble lytic murein transglycosylase-like protein
VTALVSSRRQRGTLAARTVAAAALVAGLLVAGGGELSLATGTDVAYPSVVGPALPVAAIEGWSLRTFGPVATAFRRGGVESVRPLLAGGTAQQSLLLGLYAAAAGDDDLAVEALARGGDATGVLEDWRLFRLSELLLARGDLAGARSAVERLLGHHTSSPLYPRAYVEHLEITRRQGDWLAALRGIEAARETGLAARLPMNLGRLEWEIAAERGLGDRMREVARRLLVEAPMTATELGVVDLFRQPDGDLPWNEILTAKARLRRVEALLAAGVVEAAVSTLESIEEKDRDLEWCFVAARALTANRQGAGALDVLAARPPMPRDALTELWRLRAAAALEAATVRSGRTGTTADERSQLREAAWRDLWQVATQGDTAARAPALRQLYTMADVEENFDLALGILRRLRELDTTDITGYLDLWKLGWREFDRRNTTGAIGIWRELQDLYPETSRARQALYWSAVAHQELGDADRGRDLLRQVLATDTIDFYARHAARRLGVAPRRVVRAASESWPDDPALGRAALLSELGLDGLARIELEILRDDSDARAADSLEALILARQGERRQSIDPLWRAFRALGKPGQTAVPESVRSLYYPLDYGDIVERWAKDRGLPPALVYGIIRQESAFDAAAVSRSGARGLMQMMPATGRELAGRLRLPYSQDRLTDPDYSLQLGTQYFAQVLDLFDGNVELALAGYNGGPYRVRRWWREAGQGAELDRFIEGLPLAESSNYVKRILIFEDSYEALYGGPTQLR